MRARTPEDIGRISDSLKAVKRLSDGIVKIGPVNLIGLDGILAWVPIPGLNTLYSVGVGAFILWQGMRARVGTATLMFAALSILTDSGISVFDDVIPFLPTGSILDTLFQGHLYAVTLISGHIDKTHYVTGDYRAAINDGTHQVHRADMKARKKKRVVYLRG